MIDKDNFELEDFKYEFDFKYINLIPMYSIGNINNLFMGYVSLHQLIRGDLIHLTNDELINEFKDSLEDNEYIIYDNNNFEIKLNNITDEIIEYIKFLLKYLLILYKDFKTDYNNNKINFIRMQDEN